MGLRLEDDFGVIGTRLRTGIRTRIQSQIKCHIERQHPTDDEEIVEPPTTSPTIPSLSFYAFDISVVPFWTFDV